MTCPICKERPTKCYCQQEDLETKCWELIAEINKTYSEWCGRDLMHLPLSEAVGQVVSCLRTENAALRKERQSEVEGALALRKKFGATDTETLPMFVERVCAENADLRRQLAVECEAKHNALRQLAERERKPEECEHFSYYDGHICQKLKITSLKDEPVKAVEICPCAAWTKGKKK